MAIDTHTEHEGRTIQRDPPPPILRDHRRRIMKREQVGEGVRVVLRLQQDAVFVQVGDDADRFGQQAIGLVSVGAFAFATSYGCLFLLNKLWGIRVEAEVEVQGLDVHEHGMWGYPEFYIPVPGGYGTEHATPVGTRYATEIDWLRRMHAGGAIIAQDAATSVVWGMPGFVVNAGLADAVVRRNQEMRLPEDKRSAAVIAHQTKAIEAAFSVADRASAKFPEAPTIGEIAIACAIGYLDIRAPNDGWRGRYPQLAAWLETFSKYPSVEATKPPG